MNHLTIDNKNDAKKLMKLSICAGETLLTNGAEVSRVEDTMVRLCNSRGISIMSTPLLLRRVYSNL